MYTEKYFSNEILLAYFSQIARRKNHLLLIEQLINVFFALNVMETTYC